ncbi:phospholipase B1, membrane-associated [Drosophila guanche]|uniref:Phospholipase B1, membrane-associated n=1 Tax=Drosophila guanche TaxID=7266 RepID=A0A3B0KI06_DROGU|nr:phospholipase B1, membrane-associated [Drosophila guanche]SPP86039.1 blast:Phospholipase B1%2C membrane-associated [Drosophila guanche]
MTTIATCLWFCSLLLLMSPISTSNSRRTRRQNRSDQLLADIGVHAQSYDPRKLENGLQQYTNFDRDLRQLFLGTRRVMLNFALRNIEDLKNRNMREGKIQLPISKRKPFPCPMNNTRSEKTPTSVEKLRPGDIDIIAAFGDSLSAGNGILSNNAMDMINEFRALSFSGGGLENWRRYLTLPNILKIFNPKLYGFSVTNSLVVNHRNSRFNIAEPMIMSRDLPFQARVLIELLRRDPHVDMKRHWKLLTVYVGNNDICSDLCHWDEPQALLDQHASDLRQAFRLLRDNVPRLLINLIVVPNILLTLTTMKEIPFQCFVVHRVGCHCLMNDRLNRTQRSQRMDTLRRWQQVDLDVARLPEFHREDFAIVAHPMLANMTAPRLQNGLTDWRFFSHDCFHFSQRGHAIVSNMLWNSMLLPDDRKPRPFTIPGLFESIVCPSEEQPYFVVRPG